jgi:DNA-binding response OmpR family regulator
LFSTAGRWHFPSCGAGYLVVTMTNPSTSATRSALTLLIVDDDAPLRRILAVVLQRHGFVVLTAASREAIEVYRANRESVSVVLLDGSAATLAALRTLNPTIPCCFMSVAPEQYTAKELLDLGVDHLFPKPFASLQDLAEVLRRVGRPVG